MLFYSNSRAELIKSVFLAKLESSAPAQALRAGWGGQTLFIPVFSGKVGSLALHSPQAAQSGSS